MGVCRPEPPLARVEGIVSEWVAEELVIYDRNTRAAHALSAAAASVWELCDGRRSPEEIARELHLDRAIVAQAVAQLNQCGLLAQDPQDGISRRIALRRIAKSRGRSPDRRPADQHRADPARHRSRIHAHLRRNRLWMPTHVGGQHRLLRPRFQR